MFVLPKLAAGAPSGAMFLAILIVAAAVLTLTLVVGVTVMRAIQPASGAGPEAQLQLVDVAAFRNLADPAEDEYLRQRLSPQQFRKTQRARLRARAAYVRAAAQNSAVLVDMGQAALAAGDPRMRDAAVRLVDAALLLRRNAAFVLLRIYGGMLWPDHSTVTTGIIDRYESLSAAAMLLGRLQNPAVPVRMSIR